MAVSEQPSAGSAPVRVEFERQGDYGCLMLSGQFGQTALEQLEIGLRAAAARDLPYLILDMRDLNGMDEADLHGLVASWTHARSDGLELILLRLPKSLRSAVQASGLNHQLPIAFEGSRFERPNDAGGIKP